MTISADLYGSLPGQRRGRRGTARRSGGGGGEVAAAGGAAELVRGTEAALAELRVILPGQSGDRLVVAPGGSWPLTLPDFLVTGLPVS